MSTKIFLVPGFFGFSKIGSINYFFRVAETLKAILSERAIDAEVIECETQPTGSIAKRALRLLDEVKEHGGLNADELHFIGHSTGGLDIRLLLTPGVRLREGSDEEEIAKRTKTAVSLATPHFGTPLASFFTTMQGKNILRFLTVMATSTQGRYSLFLAAHLTSLIAQVDDRIGRKDTLIDFLSDKLLAKISVNRKDPLWTYLDEISSDQGAIIHLTPEAMDLFNAAVSDRDSIEYYSFITAAPKPNFSRILKMLSLPRATTYTIFAILYTLASRESRHYPYPSPISAATTFLENAFPFSIDEGSNDGVVPTLSQIYGKLQGAIVSDHLDVVGQFDNAGGNPFADWLASGSEFKEKRFLTLWHQIADVIEGK